jgi:hypothetical protein
MTLYPGVLWGTRGPKHSGIPKANRRDVTTNWQDRAATARDDRRLDDSR